MPEPATIEDVATRAGVSVATVSRALRGLPHVSPTTRERVRQIATELDYRANPHASRLAAGRSGTVGIALPVLNSWFYANVLAGVEAVVSEDRLDLHLVTVGGPAATDRLAAALPALSKQVDGLIVVDVFMPDGGVLAEGGLPVVTLGLDTGSYDSVTIDNLAAADEAVTHLLELGHRQIAFIGGAVGESRQTESAELRRQGMARALERFGVEDASELHVAGAFSVKGGREAMERLLAGTPRPSAVFCASDEMAIGAMAAVRDAGLSVPGDVSVVGFDDQPTAEAIGLTTVRQPVSAMAARAAALLLDRLDGGEGPARHVEMETRLQVRQTTSRFA